MIKLSNKYYTDSQKIDYKTYSLMQYFFLICGTILFFFTITSKDHLLSRFSFILFILILFIFCLILAIMKEQIVNLSVFDIMNRKFEFLGERVDMLFEEIMKRNQINENKPKPKKKK